MRFPALLCALISLGTLPVVGQQKPVLDCENTNLLQQPGNTTWKLPLSDFVKGAATAKPIVTGGCVTTVTAVNGLALMTMAFEISFSKQKDTLKKTVLSKTLDSLHQALSTLACYAEKDNDVFKEFLRIAKLPVASTQETKTKDSAVKAALLQATELPVSAAKAIKACLCMINGSKSLCSKALLSDLGSGALIVRAALDGLLLMANSNLDGLAEPDRSRLRSACQEVSQQGKALLEEIMAFVTA